ncbi:MAG: hypothetical protein GY862_27530 [Gammaproteobacteria bacterium]|nr:hypothetical protein [Gammaproteobacteria bacterium]
MMQALTLKRKLDAEKQIVVDFPQLNEGDEIELIVVINRCPKASNSGNKCFDMEKWANQWETDLGENIQSTDVESFTGRKF